MVTEFSSAVIQPESYQFDSNILIKPIEEISIADRLFPAIPTALKDLENKYFEIGAQDGPDLVPDYQETSKTDLESTKKLVPVYVLQKGVHWTRFQFERAAVDIQNINDRIAALAPKFSEQKDRAVIAGNTDPSIDGLMSAARATDASLTASVTSFGGAAKMLAQLENKLNTSLKSAYTLIPKWLLMTTDVADVCRYTFSTVDDTVSAWDYLNKKMNGEVYTSNDLGATTPIANDGTQNIMLGTYSLQTAAIYQSPVSRLDVSKHEAEVSWDFLQKIGTAAFRTDAFYFEDAVTIT